MPTPMLLGIAGEKESGKNTAAKILEGLCGNDYRFSSKGLADVLKISAAKALGFEEEDDEALIRCMDQLKTCGTVTTTIEWGPNDVQEIRISGREYLQFYGTEAHREVFGDSFWIDYLIPTDEARLYRRWGQPDQSLTQMMMVTDCRFPNEVERVKRLGGLVLEVKKSSSHSGDKHASEKPLPRHLVDEIIHNNGTIEGFEEILVRFFNRRMRAGLSSGSGRWD